MNMNTPIEKIEICTLALNVDYHADKLFNASYSNQQTGNNIPLKKHLEAIKRAIASLEDKIKE